MKSLKTTLMTAGLAVAAATGAHAADIYQPQPQMIEPLPMKEDFGSKWYLRGYVGMSNQQVDELSDAATAAAGNVTTLDSGFDSAPIVGAAIGYRLNSWLRGDISGEYRGGATFHGLQTYTDATGTYDDNYSGTKSEWLVMANAYVDLGSWHGISPYVGAGIGGAYTSIDNFRDIGVANAAVGYANADPSFDLAWALYAGVGYEVAPNLTMELGYRYVSLGDAKTKDMYSYNSPTNPGTFNPYTFKDLTSHDVFLGFRYAM